MNEEQLKREIEDALSVEPSPHFAAHVRARIAESPRRSPVWIRWGVAGAGVALAAVMTAVVLLEQNPVETPKPAEMAQKAAEQKLQTPLLPAPQQPGPVHRAVRPSPPKTSEPEVLIDPQEVAAFRRFVEGVREDRIDLTKLIELQQAAAKTNPIEEIALMPIENLEPLVIESLTVGTRKIEGGSL